TAAGTSATNAANSATAAAASAVVAAASLQPNRIDTDMTIPDGYNAIRFGDFEIGADVTITLLGNSQLVII
ncbi:MAG: hypothetical protein WCI45_03200, partial [Desulfuromonadales bacterium]